MINREKHDRMANAIRFLSMDAVEKANSGHPGLPMGAADIATVLFTRFLKYDPQNPNWADRDRFILSAGHGSMLLYSLLYLTGYEDIDIDQIKNFRQLGSRTAGHPEYGHAAGIETTTGPLGQGLANSVGFALAERILNAKFGNELVDHYTYVLAGDGCLMEGVSQEAISLAGHLKLNKLIVFWDDNNISIDGAISLTDSTDQLARFAASGWATASVDGHDPEAIAAAIEAAKKSDRPTLIGCRTTIGFGAPTKAGTNKVHGSPLGAEEIAGARKALGWDAKPFEVPSDILDAWRLAGLNSVKKRKEWEARLAAAEIGLRNEFERRMRGELPGGFDAVIADYKKKLVADKPKVATRKSSEMALEVINGAVPETIGGSADLTGSNNTKTSQTKSVTAADYGQRYVHYGIRELGMAAAMNGMALHGGVIPYSGTFLCFSDYARPAMRLASLMGIRSIFVMTHDSIGLGEDGPTHQPVEQLAALRAIPNHIVFRPADATEAAECWQVALESVKTPSTLALTRQNLPAVRLEYVEENLCSYGAYELATANGDAEVTIFASGSEVEIALAARTTLQAQGHPTRVVSVPAFELFEEQSDAYKDAIIGKAPVKVAIEAAIRLGWDRFIGTDGIFVGMHGFGASGTIEQLYPHFGITADATVAAVTERLKGGAGAGRAAGASLKMEPAKPHG
jgi:transketolase